GLREVERRTDFGFVERVQRRDHRARRVHREDNPKSTVRSDCATKRSYQFSVFSFGEEKPKTQAHTPCLGHLTRPVFQTHVLPKFWRLLARRLPALLKRGSTSKE